MARNAEASAREQTHYLDQWKDFSGRIFLFIIFSIEGNNVGDNGDKESDWNISGGVRWCWGCGDDGGGNISVGSDDSLGCMTIMMVIVMIVLIVVVVRDVVMVLMTMVMIVMVVIYRLSRSHKLPDYGAYVTWSRSLVYLSPRV